MPEKINLPEPPDVAALGINKVTDGPPLPKEWNVKWPERLSSMMKEQWPGVPIPRKWGEAVMHGLPLGIGEGVLTIVNKLGM
ncbi:MAG: hypothetical protein PHQ43_01215 [Dehalococcoidales bacterium]|nr:hypothetical protein [Dehalococcoidales bacterium]